MTFDPLMLLVKLLGQAWLREVRQEDLRLLTAFTDLGQHLPQDSPGLLELASEYQRLFGFNLPPYESVFIDPSALLGAPAAARVQAVYTRGGWQPPEEARAGAQDHLGLQMLALADLWSGAGLPSAADRNALLAASSRKGVLQSNGHAPDADQTGTDGSAGRLAADSAMTLWREHLALWAPAFILTLRRLQPHPFYHDLGESTLELLLAYLPERSAGAGRVYSQEDPFPQLPAAPQYRANLPEGENGHHLEDEDSEPKQADAAGASLKSLLHRLLTPRQAGVYLTRQDLAALGQALDLPVGAGERFRMLQSLFELADQYDMLDQLLARLIGMLSDAGQEYAALARRFPAWGPYAQAWRSRLDESRRLLRQGLE